MFTGLEASPLQSLPSEEYQTATYLINGLIVASIFSIVLVVIAYAGHKSKKAGAKAIIIEKTGLNHTTGLEGRVIQVELIIRNPHSVPLDIDRIYGTLRRNDVSLGSVAISDVISIAPLSSTTVRRSFGLSAFSDLKDLTEAESAPGKYVLTGTVLADTVYGRTIVRFKTEPIREVLS